MWCGQEQERESEGVIHEADSKESGAGEGHTRQYDKVGVGGDIGWLLLGVIPSLKKCKILEEKQGVRRILGSRCGEGKEDESFLYLFLASSSSTKSWWQWSKFATLDFNFVLKLGEPEILEKYQRSLGDVWKFSK